MKQTIQARQAFADGTEGRCVSVHIAAGIVFLPATPRAACGSLVGWSVWAASCRG